MPVPVPARSESLRLIVPDWPAPATIGSLSTTRMGGVSQAPFDHLNLGEHVGDNIQAVGANRSLLQEALGTDVRCQWLNQVHGAEVARLERVGPVLDADAAVTQKPAIACLVMTADCLPVLFCDRQGTRVAAAHAGWRGLAAGVLEATLEAMRVPPHELLCWLGPAIGPRAFEVGAEVRQQFCRQYPEAEAAFVSQDRLRNSWLADIYQLARLRLARAGVTAIYGGEACTYTDRERFFSYRRDGQTGRMASLIWIKP
ncbi:MAG: YfiH family protein [Motiliproteus sp.]|jgi:YfiH family protein